MTSSLKMALSAATLVAGLAATPALAQGGGKLGGGGIGGGAPITAPAAPMAAPQVHAAPTGVPQINVPHAYVPQVPAPQVHVPQVYAPQGGPGGVYAAPRVHNPVITPMVKGSPWNGGGVTSLPRQPHAWPGNRVATPPHDTAQSMYHGGRHHRGRGHWRGGVWYPYYLGGYDDAYGVYDDTDECTLRRVRVHTPYGWRRVWRRVCV